MAGMSPIQHRCAALLMALAMASCTPDPVDLTEESDAGTDAAPDVPVAPDTGDVGPDVNLGELPASNCRFPEAPDLSPLRARRAFPSLSFEQPLFVTSARDGTDRLFVVQKGGRVLVFPNDEATTQATVFLDLGDKVLARPGNDERGLLGMAFDPDFANNGHFYLNYTANAPNSPTTVSRFTVDRNNPDLGDISSEVVYLSFDQPYPNHNGGMLAFGPDGYLYISAGDGGSAGDPNRHGQNVETVYGTILRIDVAGSDTPGSYRVPRDNPFLGPGMDEVWAYGLRNVWRFSFDRVTGQLWAADVGQRRVEEVDLIERGGNYGWGTMEGSECFDDEGDCEDPSFIPPLAEYDHTVGLSITGGYVYRGEKLPGLAGAYVYGDFAQGQIFALTLGDGAGESPPGHKTTGGAEVTQIAETGRKIASFGEDEAGELYFLDFADGYLFTLEAVDGGGNQEPLPLRLSDTGCFSDMATQTPDPGLIPYDVNAKLWSDGSSKDRWFVLPEGGKIGYTEAGPWEFPDRTIFVKNFSLDDDTGSRVIETRFLVKDPDGWHGYSYQWNEGQSEAYLLNSSVTKTFNLTIDGRATELVWGYPSRAQCRACHTVASGGVLGGSTGQLERMGTWQGKPVNQVALVEGFGLFDGEIPQAREGFPDPFGDAPLETRARSYLHANCAHCHLPDGVATSDIDIRFETSLSASKTCNEDPQEGDLGTPGLKLIDPGNAQNSSVFRRMIIRDENGMPSLASGIVHQEAALLVGAWIDDLDGCQ